MNVLHLGKFDAFGGIERHVRSLLRGLIASGRVHAINLVANNKARTDRHTEHGYLTVRAACWGTPFSLALAPTLPHIARELHREHKFDIVHLHFPDPLGQFVAMSLPRGVRRIVSWHSDIVRQRAALALYRPFQQRFLRTVDAVIGATPYHFSSSTQLPHLSEDKRHVIPYGFDAHALQPSPASDARRALLLTERGSRGALFALGRHVYYKGFDVLIRAMRTVNALLWIGGSGPLTAQLAALIASEGVAARVRLVGPIPEDELLAYYQACDAFVLPSVAVAEGFGLVQLEAMYCERPVVATRLGTGVEWVNIDGETGLLVPPGDDAALAAALTRLLTDTALRARLGANGRARVLGEFSERNMVERMLAVYDGALAS